MKEYRGLYDEFLENYTHGQTSGAEVGEVIAKLAQCFCDLNTAYGAAEIRLNATASKLIEQEDEKTGKAISAAKADVLTKATAEYADYNEIRKHLQNAETCINALKALQKGLLQEYSHVGVS